MPCEPKQVTGFYCLWYDNPLKDSSDLMTGTELPESKNLLIRISSNTRMLKLKQHLYFKAKLIQNTK